MFERDYRMRHGRPGAHDANVRPLRLASRAEVSLAAEVRQGSNHWVKVRLRDISATGFQLDWFAGCKEHLPISVRIAGGQVIQANIRRKNITGIGCEFERPLHPSVFDHIVQLSTAEVEALPQRSRRLSQL